MKNQIAIILFVFTSLQSCSTFQKVPVSLEEAVDNGKVKIIDGTGMRRVFDDITKVDSVYYGMQKSYVGKKKSISRYVLIPHQDSLKVYLSKNQVYRVWVKLKNQSEDHKRKGVLYAMTDSTISVSSSTSRKDYWNSTDLITDAKPKNDRFAVEELRIDNIKTIKTRRINSITRGALIGAATAFSFGLFVDENIYFKIYAGSIFSIVGVPVGAFIGSLRHNIPIHGSISNYNRSKIRLHPLHDYSENKIEVIPITDSLLGYEQGWKAYFSKKEMKEVLEYDTKGRTKTR